MAGVEDLHCISIPAGADLSALQFTAVILGSDKAVVGATTTTAPIIGILQNKPTSGQAAAVAVMGVAKAKAGGTWGSGDKLTATTGGLLIATTTEPNHYVGIALEDAASGDVAQVLIQPGMVAAA